MMKLSKTSNTLIGNEVEPTDEFQYRYVIGIDLGTTNSAVSYADLTTTNNQISLFSVPQVVSLGEVGERPLLPSFLYFPGPYEIRPEYIRLPWNENPEYVVGEFAREQGKLVPDRLISSVKSWLCHAKVDRKAPILPWGVSESNIRRVSPVEASAIYLEHIRNAWNYTFVGNRESSFFEEQSVVLTVPASFDEVARELTVEAARMARIPRLILLEEPLAAFYSWIYRHRDEWNTIMHPGEIILVCDVGGGTTDFTIIIVKEGEKGLRFERLAVGEHLLLGGDNMDITLGRYIETRLFKKPGALDAQQWHQLCHRCRTAKELLLGSENTSEVSITVVGRGTKLIGNTFTTSLSQEAVRDLIIEGFFPVTSLNDHPRTDGRAGLTEWGLPYVQDPAITRHLAAFWCRFENLIREETGRNHPFPDFILFNGGALFSPILRSRIREIVGRWFEDRAGKGWQPLELDNPRPDLAVAFGAAYYGMVRAGKGVRIGAGSPRTYYVEVDRTPEIDKTQHKAVCIVPRGTEEGFEVELDEPGFQVITNKPVSFMLLGSTTRLGDQLGSVVVLEDDEVAVLPPIRTVLRFGKKGTTQNIPIKLGLRLTEVGTLELWCKSLTTPHTWQLQFDVRQYGDTEQIAEPLKETLDDNVINLGLSIIKRTFTPGHKDNEISPNDLIRMLTDTFDLSRNKWSLTLIRKIFDVLLDVSEGRKRTFHHEARWYNLLGFCMRPGYGHPVDEWRMKNIWKLYPENLSFPRHPQCRIEWWIFWRRVAGGLTVGQQLHIFQNIRHLVEDESRKSKKTKKNRSIPEQELRELRMALANFEHLPIDVKTRLGYSLLDVILSSKKPKFQDVWALGRFGARVPLYGHLDKVIPPEGVVEWIERMLHHFGILKGQSLLHKKDYSIMIARCIVHMARYTGDRARDLPEDTRKRVYELLLNYVPGDILIPLIELQSESLSAEEREWSFGESLPAGLILLE